MSAERFDKPRTERKLNRIKAVYFYIKKNGRAKTGELAEEFGMCHRTVQRDLDVLLYNDLIKADKKGIWTVTDRKVKGE